MTATTQSQATLGGAMVDTQGATSMQSGVFGEGDLGHIYMDPRTGVIIIPQQVDRMMSRVITNTEAIQRSSLVKQIAASHASPQSVSTEMSTSIVDGACDSETEDCTGTHTVQNQVGNQVNKSGPLLLRFS